MIEIAGVKLYSVNDMAKELKISAVTIRAYLRQGKIKAKKIGGKWYATVESLRSFLQE